MLEKSVTPEVASNAQAQSAPPLSNEEAERRFVEQLDALVEEAAQSTKIDVLADCLAWAIARIVVGYDSVAVAGDVMFRIGSHITRLVEKRNAQVEAEEARKTGQLFQ